MTMRLVTCSLLLIANLTATWALAAPQNGGLAFSYVVPKDDFAQRVDKGWGAALIFDYPLAGAFDLVGTAGYYRFSGLDPSSGTSEQGESLSLWELAAGPQVDLGVLYLGCDAGYYTDLAEWGLVPNLGLRKKTIDFGLRYKVTDVGRFLAVRVGMFF